MADALTPPLAVAALVLCVGGATKFRCPVTAGRALAELGVPAPVALVRLLAVVELAVGACALAWPAAVPRVALAVLYSGFAAASTLLARRRSSCGCFGDRETPASVAQAALSSCLALVSLGAAIWQAHGAEWLLARSAPTAVTVTLGVGAAAYALMLAYTELPSAWSTWAGVRSD